MDQVIDRSDRHLRPVRFAVRKSYCLISGYYHLLCLSETDPFLATVGVVVVDDAVALEVALAVAPSLDFVAAAGAGAGAAAAVLVDLLR